MVIGSTISHYRIVEKLGEGGMGVVYKAEDTTLGRAVALKFLAPHLLSNVEARQRFEQEAKTAAALNHPNICTLYEIDEADGHAFLALEFVDGEALDEISARGPLPFAQAADYSAQAARGLAAAHARGIIHRDIKGGNIMVTTDGLVKLMDFGLARLSTDSRLTTDGAVLGTPAYMAPEQLEGIEIDARADVWALGVVLYEMLAGRLPFEAQYQQALLYAVMHDQPEPLADVPEELAAIVVKALEKDPSERYVDAAEMGTAIDAFADAERSSSATLTPAKRGGEWQSKQRLFGLPLIHIATGYDPQTGRIRIAKGIVAIGAIAVGGVAAGGISIGAVAIGGIAAGISSLGGIALAVWMAFGAVTVGLDPQGIVAIGPDGTRVITARELGASTEELAERPSVAVMPFVNSSGDPEFEYFSDGMTDELISALGKVQGLKVVGRSSVFRFKGQQYDPAEVGQRLQVGALLEGTVRRAGERLRITTQLINATDGFELWSDRYESEMKDVFDVQDEISRAMVGALASELLGGIAQPIVKRSTDHPEAYRLYLQGRRWESTSDAARRRVELLEEALSLDPDYAEAHAVLGEALAFLSILGLERPSEVMERARQEANRAIELDETVREGHIALALVLDNYDWDYEGAERSYRRALALGPTAYSRVMYGLLLANTGRFDESIDQIEQALGIDPLSIRANLGLTYVLGFAGRYEAALQQAQKSLGIDENWTLAHMHAANAYLGLNQPRKALESAQAALRYAPNDAILLGALGRSQAAADQQTQAEATLEHLIALRTQGYSSALRIAEVYASLGEFDNAFEWLEVALEERDGLLSEVRHPVIFERLPEDDRYPGFVERIGSSFR